MTSCLAACFGFTEVGSITVYGKGHVMSDLLAMLHEQGIVCIIPLFAVLPCLPCCVCVQGCDREGNHLALVHIGSGHILGEHV